MRDTNASVRLRSSANFSDGTPTVSAISASRLVGRADDVSRFTVSFRSGSQISPRIQSAGAPTDVGQYMMATLRPFSRAASQSVRAFRSFAYQYQLRVDPDSVQVVLAGMPCFAGRTPVTMLACAG